MGRGKNQIVPFVSLEGIMRENKKGDDDLRSQGRITQDEKRDGQKGGGQEK